MGVFKIGGIIVAVVIVMVVVSKVGVLVVLITRVVVEVLSIKNSINIMSRSRIIINNRIM